MDIVINQIAVMLILVLLGYLAGRTGYLPENSSVYISSLVIKVTAPSLIITTMAAYEFTAKTLRDGLSVSLYALCFIAAAFLIGLAVSRLLRLEGVKANVFRAHVMFGNTGYLALPLFKALFGEKGLVYAVFFIITHDVLVWTVGVYLLNRHGRKTWKDNLRQFFNANTLSYTLGLVLALTNFHYFVRESPVAGAVYDALYNTLNPLGNATLYLVMIFIGLNLSESRMGGPRELFRKRATMALVFLKLLLIPALAYALLGLFGGSIDPFVRAIVVLELAMPCAAMIPALALQYGSDYRFATDNVVYTTLLVMFTLPLFLLLLNITGG
jgi:predicted permease